jgi:hypothetical protein
MEKILNDNKMLKEVVKALQEKLDNEHKELEKERLKRLCNGCKKEQTDTGE